MRTCSPKRCGCYGKHPIRTGRHQRDPRTASASSGMHDHSVSTLEQPAPRGHAWHTLNMEHKGCCASPPASRHEGIIKLTSILSQYTNPLSESALPLNSP